MDRARVLTMLLLLLLDYVEADTVCQKAYGGTCINMYYNTCLAGYTATLSSCGFQEMCCIPPVPPNNIPPISDGVCGVAYPEPATGSQRIVGGVQAQKGEFPWQASLRSYTANKHHTCGGILVDHEWILTAAHCFENNKNPYAWNAILGEYDRAVTEGHERLFKVETIFVHSGFNKGSGLGNDIAMLQISPPVQNYTAYIRPACLPSSGESFTGLTCVVSGWGSTTDGGYSSRLLHKATVPILSAPTCTYLFDGPLPGGELCAGYRQGGHDACQGDSGGPLVCYKDGRWKATGVVSYGYGCGNAYLPGVYTRVSFYRHWVDQVMTYSTGSKKRDVNYFTL